MLLAKMRKMGKLINILGVETLNPPQVGRDWCTLRISCFESSCLPCIFRKKTSKVWQNIAQLNIFSLVPCDLFIYLILVIILVNTDKLININHSVVFANLFIKV